ncbi:HIT family protein [Alteribacillus sp. HJP-4]|uniref:HIT family protein n=1 Tax=Alteribacillus sp. HJP-4 TaxID=2775394 RepID=UPI0035CCCA1D
MNCLGCNLANKHEPVNVVFEDEHVCCILDHDPFNEGHVLILPKKDIFDVEELDDATALSIMKASKLISKAINRVCNPDGITICQNGGIFNELTHYHMHVVPRYKNQSFATFYSDHDVTIEEEVKLNSTKRKLTAAITNI